MMPKMSKKDDLTYGTGKAIEGLVNIDQSRRNGDFKSQG
jgi:hypothetical protein